MKTVFTPRRGSALALAMIFAIVGIMITVSYLEYIQTAGRAGKSESGRDVSLLVARAGLQMHSYLLKKNFFKFEQYYLTGSAMGGNYEVLSRSYYDQGSRILEQTAIGRLGATAAAVSRLVQANTPTDYVRFFDGNYFNVLYSITSNIPSVFWLGPVRSNGSIGLGVADGGYPYKYGYGCMQSPPTFCNKEVDDEVFAGYSAAELNLNFNSVRYSPYFKQHNPHLLVNGKYNNDYLIPQRWGHLAFIVKDKGIKGPVIATAGHFFIPKNFPFEDYPTGSNFGAANFIRNTSPTFTNGKAMRHNSDFCNPVLIGEEDDPHVIIDEDDGTYPVAAATNKAGRFGLYSRLRTFEYYNLVTTKKESTLAHGKAKKRLLMANEEGFGLKFFPLLHTAGYVTGQNTQDSPDIIRQMWGNAYTGMPLSQSTFTQGFDKYGFSSELPYPLDDFRDQMPRISLPTTLTPEGLVRSRRAGTDLLRIPTVRRRIGGIDYANMPFKSPDDWQTEIRRYYNALTDPVYAYPSLRGRTVTLVNEYSREKIPCPDLRLPAVYNKLEGFKVRNRKGYATTWAAAIDPAASYPDFTSAHTGGGETIGRYEIFRNIEHYFDRHHFSRVATEKGGLWSNDYLVAYLDFQVPATPAVGYFFKQNGGGAFGSLPDCGATVSENNTPLNPAWITSTASASMNNDEPTGLFTWNYAASQAGVVASCQSVMPNDGFYEGDRFNPHLALQDASRFTGGYAYLEFTTDLLNDGYGLNNAPAAPSKYLYDDPIHLSLTNAGGSGQAALLSTQHTPPAGQYTPHTNTGIFLGYQNPANVCRYPSAAQFASMKTHFSQNGTPASAGQCSWQLPPDVFGSMGYRKLGTGAWQWHWYNSYNGGGSWAQPLMLIRRLFINISSPIGVFNAEATALHPTKNVGTTNRLSNSQVSGASQGGVKVDIIVAKQNIRGSDLITNIGSAPDAVFVNPWFKLYYAPGDKDIGTNVQVYDPNAKFEIPDLMVGNSEMCQPYYRGTVINMRYGFELYNYSHLINYPWPYNYAVDAGRTIKPNWDNSSWLKPQFPLPSGWKWYAPLAEECMALDLSLINASNFPRAAFDRGEPGVIYSRVPLIVYGDPKVPVTVVCEKNIYLKSINSRDGSGTVKKLGGRDKPSVGIISASGVWVAPINEASDEYSLPGGSRDIILNNVAIWTTKGFFCMLSHYYPKMALCGSVITMDSMFGKEFHESYINHGESFNGANKSRTPISGLGATDAWYRQNDNTFSRESYQYTRNFRGDDRGATSDVIEGPPPHFPVYYVRVNEGIFPLEQASLIIENYRPFVETNRDIPEAVLEKVKELRSTMQ